MAMDGSENNNDNSNHVRSVTVALGVVTPNHIDVENYASLYTGHTRTAHPHFITNHCHSRNLELKALRMSLDEIRKGDNTMLFKECVEKINNRLEPAYALDQEWIDMVDRHAAQRQEKLEMELNGYKEGIKCHTFGWAKRNTEERSERPVGVDDSEVEVPTDIDESDDEDDNAELLAKLERIKRERVEEKLQKVTDYIGMPPFNAAGATATNQADAAPVVSPAEQAYNSLCYNFPVVDTAALAALATFYKYLVGRTLNRGSLLELQFGLGRVRVNSKGFRSR